MKGLAVWIDDGDAVVQPGELKSLLEVGVTSLSVKYTEVPGKLGGKHIRSTAALGDRIIMTEDAWFAMSLPGETEVALAGDRRR